GLAAERRAAREAGASARVIDNRTTRPRSYSRPDGKNWDWLGLSRTQPGHWMGSMTPEQGRRQQAGPIRVQITCARGGEQWILLREVQVPESPPAVEQ